MSTPSPPKPWELPGATGESGLPSNSLTMSTGATATGPGASTIPPSLPDRPSSLNSVVNQTASNYSPYGQSRLGTTPYSSYGGGYSSYSSPYSRFGGMNSMYGGGYGGMNSMYGGMGTGMGGYGGGMYGGGYPGMPDDPNNPSLTQTFNQSTAATFQIIESLVGAFGGFAQMLESTYMATRSSFMAMVSVAEQFGNLRNTLGSVLGIFAILRWLRTLLAKVTGRPPPADATSLTPADFSSFLSGQPSSPHNQPAHLPDGSPNPAAQPRLSKKPFIMFALAVVGLPYLMNKLIRALARSAEAEQQQRALQQQQQYPQQTFDPSNPAANNPTLDPSKLDFCRCLYDYTPDPQLATTQPSLDLAVKKGDLVAVLSKTDPISGQPSQWWHCRARDGKLGYLPAPYLEIVTRRPPGATANTPMAPQGATPQRALASIEAQGRIESAPGSRTTTLLSGSSIPGGGRIIPGSETERTRSLNSVSVPMAGTGTMKGSGAKGDISVEAFQKSAFYSGS